MRWRARWAGSATPCAAFSREPSKRSSGSPSPRQRKSAVGSTALSRWARDAPGPGLGGILMGEHPGEVTAAPLETAAAVLGLIEKLALDPGADVAKLERVIAIYERLKAKEAELAFNAAKGRILDQL